MHGYLQSRDYAETLGDFVKGANGLTNLLSASDEVRREIKHNRVTTEVVAEKLILVDKPTLSAQAAARRDPTDAERVGDNGNAQRKPARNDNGAKDAAVTLAAATPETGE